MDHIEQMDDKSKLGFDIMDMKCGEVFLNTNGNLILICTLCEIKFKEFQEYADHIMEKHFLFHVLDDNDNPSLEDNEFQSFTSHDDTTTDTIKRELEENYEGLEDGCQLIEEIEFLEPLDKILEPIEELDDVTNIMENVEFIEEFDETLNYEETDNIIHELYNTSTTMPTKDDMSSMPTAKSIEETIYLNLQAEKRENQNALAVKEQIYNCGTHPFMNGKKRFYCWQCDKGFYSRSGYRSHTRIHTGERKYQCSREECQKSFKTLYSYKKHAEYCVDECNMQCFECKMVFNDRETYRRHRKTHSHPFKCKKCNVNMKTARSLEHHMQSHREAQEIICQLCSTSFYDHNDLLSHLRSKHSGAAQFKVYVRQT